MTAIYIPGQSRWRLPEPKPNIDSSMTSGATLTATGHKAAMIGEVYWADRGSHDVQKIHFRTGAVTFDAASVFRGSLQDVSLTVGNPAQPDGTQDQTADITGAALVANSWITTGNLSANRTAAHGALLAVVLEYQTFTAADSVAITAMRANYANAQAFGLPIFLRDTGAGWSAAANCSPNVLLEAADGTFGTFLGAEAASDIGTLTYNSGSTPDENANEFSLPFPTTVVGCWAQIAAAGDFDIVLYEGTTALVTKSIDKEWVFSASAPRYHEWLFPTPQATVKDTTYRLAFKPTSASNIIIPYEDVAAAGHRVARVGGTAFNLNTRTDAGAWGTVSTTRVLRAGLLLGTSDDGAGGGGGDTGGLNRFNAGFN